MNDQSADLLILLKAAVNDQPAYLNEPADFDAILTLTAEQNLQALVGEKLCEDAAFQQSAFYEKAASAILRIVGDQAVWTDAFLQLYREFTRAGVRPLVMKGLICRELYGGLCDHRPSSDEDILVRKEEFDQVREVLERNGWQMERDRVTSKELDAVQEVTFDNVDCGLHIEVHTNAIGLETGIRRQMNEYFTDVFGKAIPVEIRGTTVWTMCHTDHFLFLVFHAFKHLMSGGLGIRQALDILMYQKRFGTEIDWNRVRAALQESDAESFLGDILEIGRKYLGIRSSWDLPVNCPDELLDDMLNCGLFGNTTQAMCTAASMTYAAADAGDGYSTWKALWGALFPAREFMIAHDPELADRPWLLPVCWMKRFGRFLRHNRENEGGLATESMEISRRRIALLKKYGVIAEKGNRNKR